MNVTITCDRCGNTVEGIRDSFEFEGRTIKTTSGFYDLSEDGGWVRFAQSGEKQICDECMFGDPEYQKIYGMVKNTLR